MSNEAENRTCPKCGVEISREAPQGLCPKCLLEDAALTTDNSAAPKSKPQPPSIEELNVAFPQLTVTEFIGQGGMGFVFKAQQPKLERDVALKILPQSLAEDPAFAERFAREGRMLAKLNHPNIVTVYDFGEAAGYFYLLMEFVDGVNLRQAMRASRFTPEQALSIVPSVCEALQFAHDEGVLHRDIKPENILLDTKGRVKIADFGIAKFIEGRDALPRIQADPQVSPTTLTQVGSSLGTPQYMAPEQIEKPGEVDHRADIYSLGVVFYELLTGELPSGDIAPPSSKTPVNPQVDEVVLRALEKERERRQSSATEFKTQVENATKTKVHSDPSARKFSKAKAGFLHGILVGLSVLIGLSTTVVLKTFGFTMGFSLAVVTPLLVLLVVVFARRPISIEKGGLGFLALGLLILGPLLIPVVHLAGRIQNENDSTQKQEANSQLREETELRIQSLEEKVSNLSEELDSATDETAREALNAEIHASERELFEAKRELSRLDIDSMRANFRAEVELFQKLRILSFFVCVPLVFAGTAVGWRHLNRLHGTPRPHHGLVPAMFAALLAPLLLGYGLCALVFLLPLNHGSWVPLGLLLTNLAALAFAIWFVRWTWKWVRSENALDTAQARSKSGLVDLWLRRALWFIAITSTLVVVAVVALYFVRSGTFSDRTGNTLVTGSRVPKAAHTGANGNSVYLVHDDVELHYALFYQGDFNSSSRSSNNSATGSWKDDFTLTLSNGRAFAFQREALFPDELYINGQDYDLREGRVFKLQSDGTARQLTLFPSLASARNPDELNQLIDRDTGTSGDFTEGQYQGTDDIDEFVALYLDASRSGEKAFVESMILREALNPENQDMAIALLAPGRPQNIESITVESVQQRLRRLREQPDSFDHLPDDVEPRHIVYVKHHPEVGENYSIDSTKYFPVVEKDRKLYIGAFYSEDLQTAAAGFGPVITRVIQSSETETNLFLNLDTGELLTPPKAIRDLFRASRAERSSWERSSDRRALQMREWLQNSGANLVISGNEDLETLELHEVVALPMNVFSNGVAVPFGFDEAGATYLATRFGPMLEDTAKTRREIGSPTIWTIRPGFNPTLNERRDSFCFRTSLGNFGIIQIINAETNPRGVRVRYKLVQNDDSGLDYPRALRELKSAMPTLEALENTLEQKDLESALTLASTALRQMQTYNIYVHGTSFEISQGVLDVFSLAIEALKVGNLERANTLLESSMNSVDIDLPEKLEAFVNRNSNSAEVQNE